VRPRSLQIWNYYLAENISWSPIRTAIYILMIFFVFFWAARGTKHTGEVALTNFKIILRIFFRKESEIGLTKWSWTHGIYTRPMHWRCKVRFETAITVLTVITPHSTFQITVSQYYYVRPYKSVPSYSTIMTVIWPFGSIFGLKQFFSFWTIVNEYN
jgi:hypothetical protein